MDNIDEQIETAFHSTELILVFVTLFFTLRYPEIQSAIEEKIPEGTAAKKVCKLKLAKSLKVKCVPFVVISGVSVYLYLPLFVKVILASTFSPWNFDFTRTSFFVIASMVGGFFAWSVVLAYQIFLRMLQCDN